MSAKRLLQPTFSTTVCPWTAENPRHDHQLIFALGEARLLLVWCEYYAVSPSQTLRQPTHKDTGIGDEMPCRIVGRTSVDRGRTWGPRFVVQENKWEHNVKHPNMLRLDSGEILLTFTAWESDAQRNVYARRSADDGESWGTVTRVSQPGFYCNNHDRILRLSSGRILLPTHGVLGGGAYQGGGSTLCSWVYYSDDGFDTWRKSAEMTAPGRGAHEPTMVELRDGRLLCFLRTTTGRIWQAHSEDQGVTWSEPVGTQFSAPDSEALLTRVPATGDLLLLWNDVESQSNWPRTPLTAAVSADEGHSWRTVGDLDNRPDQDAAYPAVFFHADEALVTWYSRDAARWARDSEVALRIYPLDELYS
jgi:sialidase-1